ncbi:hypothetical protein [Bacillus thuringiensis]|uniref:RES domain-containing protein n=1 Tax=Bacillus thuringiensis subsp. higo TaxID=132266 RepID=A0A9X6QVW8_BACUH|nr:hypothetical protein [Bacillus thuringiensis]OUB59733.1 hypothetical protein BK716_03665 [Bacillus thuringiensis serovar higo]
MIIILILSEEQIKVAIELDHLNEQETVSDNYAQKAYNLYNDLHIKPTFNRNSSKILLEGFEFFRNYANIKYLIKWILGILPYVDLFSNTGKLPLTRTQDNFKSYVETILDTYQKELDKINHTIPKKYNMLKPIALQSTKNFCIEILHSIDEYYKGFPAKAYYTFADGLNRNLKNSAFLTNNIIHTSQEMLFYKMRIGTSHTFSNQEMLHIPFELRGIVGTNRYSIPGLPCVYLGSSPLSCWEELNKPDLNTIQTSLFKSNNINYLDISMTPTDFVEELIRNYDAHPQNIITHDIMAYVFLWPLIAACSIRVKNKNDTFKPEYIIPQLLLQFIRDSNDIDGVSYFSTKIDKYTSETSELYRNFAFPVQAVKDKGLCPILQEKFTITTAVPWKVFELYKDSHFCLSPFIGEVKPIEIEFIDGMQLNYSSTDFYKLENFLQNKSILENKNSIPTF